MKNRTSYKFGKKIALLDSLFQRFLLGLKFLLLGLLMCGHLLAISGTTVRTSSYEYSGLGQLSKEVQEPNSPNDCLQTNYTYDSFGNKTSSSTAMCSGATGNTILSAGVARTSSTGYGTDGRFPISASNPLSQSENRSFDTRFGGITGLIGPQQPRLHLGLRQLGA